MKRKIISLLCASTMIFALVACGDESVNSESSSSKNEETKVSEEKTTSEVPEEKVEVKDPVTLKYWYRNNVGEQEYTSQVEEKLNSILASTEGYEHITIDLVPCKDYKTDLQLALASGEQVDIISLPGSGDEGEHVQQGVLLPLDDYLEANPEISADLPDWLMEMGKFGDATYYVPNYQQIANQIFVVMNKENFEATGYDYDEVQQAIYDMDQDFLFKFYEDALEAAKETIKKEHPDTTYIGDSILTYNMFYMEMGQSGFPSIQGQAQFYWDLEKGEVDFVDYREDIQAGFAKVAEYVEKGYVSKDKMSNPEPFNNGILGEYSDIFGLTVSYGTVEMVANNLNSNSANIEKNGEVIVWAVDDYNFIAHRNAAQGVGVCSLSEHPEDAANFLALLFNSKYEEFYNTLCYGIEGVHYDFVGDGKIETKEFSGSQGGADTTYCYWKWVGGNTFNAYLNQSMTQEQEDYILNEINEGSNSVVSPIVGLIFDAKPIENELIQVRNVVSEYRDAIKNGVKGADQESYLNEYFEKLETAGMSKILGELNAQAEEYLKSK